LKKYSESELVLNGEGKVYHMNLAPEDIADTCLLVGDQNRVDLIAEQFDSIRFKVQNREFYTITGSYKGKEFSAISTGIGTDNVDIVINELDALVNIDLQNRLDKADHHSLTFVRIGTCGALQEDIRPGSHVVSSYALGFDGVAHFYNLPYSEEEQRAMETFRKEIQWPDSLNKPYFKAADKELFSVLAADNYPGITLTANGFYGPQGRALRLPLVMPDLKEQLRKFEWNGSKVVNFEMESSCLFALSSALGHCASTVCLSLANRYTGEFLTDYKTPMRALVKEVLDRLSV